MGGWTFGPGLQGAGSGSGSLSAGSAGRERDSCSVYGTGRIHCERSRSVNYRRAINRAETDLRGSQEHSSPPLAPWWAWTSEMGCFGGAGVQGYPLRYVPRGPATLPICLADFGTSTFLLVSLRSEQSCAVPIWEKRACSRVPLPCVVSRPQGSLPLPGPSGSAAGRAAAPWAARSPYTASGHSRAGSPAIRAGPADGAACRSGGGEGGRGGGQVTICRASPGGATGLEGPARLPAHTLGVRP